MTASQGTSGTVSGVQACVEPELRAKASESSRGADEVDVETLGAGEQRGEQADRAGAVHEDALAGGERGGPDGAQGVAAGLDQGPGDGVDRRRAARAARSTGTRSCSASAPGQPAADPDLVPVDADVLSAGEAAAGSGRSRASCRR